MGGLKGMGWMDNIRVMWMGSRFRFTQTKCTFIAASFPIH